MPWFVILLIFICGIVFLYFLYFEFRKIRYKSIIKNTINIINDSANNPKITIYKANNIYQLEFVIEKKYLIKLIDLNPRHELIITNSESVAINANIKEWRRSSKPNFVSGIKQFINLNKANKNLIKIILIYPSCYNITKYINESDVFKLKKNQKVDGLYYIKFANFEEFLKKE